MEADHESDGGQLVTVGAHVHRGHGHDRDHRDLGEHHDRRADVRTDARPGAGDAGVRLWVGGRRRVEPAREEVGIGAQQREERQARGAVGDGGEEKRSGQGGDAEVLGEHPERLDEVRAGDRAERRGDHRHADRAATTLLGGQIGAGVPGLEIGGGAGAVDEQRDEQ